MIIETQNFIVSKINLLSTIMERWDGQLIIIPNSVLVRSDIWNIRRSKPQWDTITLKLSFHTSTEQVLALREQFQDFVAASTSDFGRDTSVNLDQFTDLETMVVKVYYSHRTNWQNMELFWARRSKIYAAVVQILKDLDITWQPLVKPVSFITEDGEPVMLPLR